MVKSSIYPFESLLLRQKRPVILKITGLFVVQWQSGNGILVSRDAQQFYAKFGFEKSDRGMVKPAKES